MAQRSFSTFKLNDQLFGVDIFFVREINKHMDITPVQHVPEFILGLINIRGQIVTVMDLKSRLGLGRSLISSHSHNIILNTGEEMKEIDGIDCQDYYKISDKVGLLVDDIGQIVTAEEEEIDKPPANMSGIESKYITGVVKLDGTLMGILSLSKILTVEKGEAAKCLTP